MCGIISAISSRRDVVPLLIDGLKRLEYRGYDSAGVAVINGKMQRLRATGRVAALESRIAEQQLTGAVGIGHTRWATHGAPSERNAHPHASGGVSVVHNGIIENHEALRSRLRQAGYIFSSDTDTEAIAHLIHWHLADGTPLFSAVQKATSELSGAYAIAVISDQTPQQLIVARNGAPLLIGLGDGENFAASDSTALAGITREVMILEDGDCAEVSRSSVHIVNPDGKPVHRECRQLAPEVATAGLGNYRHFMQKEIFEQPVALAATLEEAIRGGSFHPEVFGNNAEKILRGVNDIKILACGTSYHAGMVARYWLESIAEIPCTVEFASEYRYRKPVSSPTTLVVAISQSGETADTLAALSYATTRQQRASLCICNAPDSSLMRATNLRFQTRAGTEISVASTKAFTTQLAALAVLTITLAKLRQRLPREREQDFLNDLRYLPAAATRILELEADIEAWAEQISTAENALFLGRGDHYPIAMEGALKLKEISYIHAEAHAAGELKHGPLALVKPGLPVIALAPNNRQIDKLKSNLNEVSARGGKLFVLADHDSRLQTDNELSVIQMPDHTGLLSPILHTIPLQLLAYHTAIKRNNDVDKPRNLAKSVTVE